MRALPLPLLCILVAAGCRSTGAVPRPFPSPAPTSPVGVPGPTRVEGDPAGLPPASSEPEGPAAGVTGLALSYLGVPYRNGGDDPARGFDCSGFVWYVFGQNGIAVPRTVTDQYRTGTEVDTRDVRPGDLVFFNTTGGTPSHVGIAIGGERFVHAPSTAGDVRIERLTVSYWARRLVGIRRME